MYGWGTYRGLGLLDYYGLLAQANLQDCDSMDSACVSNNVAKQAAVQDLWASKYQTTGAPDDLKLTFTPQTQAEVQEFYNPSDLFWSGNVVDTRGIMSTSAGSKPAAPYVPPVTAPVVASHTPAVLKPGLLPGGWTDTFQLPAPSSIPWWGWLLGAGVGVFALKGAR